MLRDNLKDKEYFEEFLSYENKRIQKFEDALISVGDDAKKIQQCEMYLANFYKNKINAMYSSGLSKADIKKEVKCFLLHLSRSGEISYDNMIDALSMMIVFGCYEKRLEHLAMDSKDKLIRILSRYLKIKVGDEENEILLFPDIFSSFYEALTLDVNNEENKLIDFMNNKWYTLNKESPWYESHKSKNNIYVGYWCWLAIAVIKIKGFELKKFANVKYIPIDMLEE